MFYKSRPYLLYISQTLWRLHCSVPTSDAHELIFVSFKSVSIEYGSLPIFFDKRADSIDFTAYFIVQCMFCVLRIKLLVMW